MTTRNILKILINGKHKTFFNQIFPHNLRRNCLLQGDIEGKIKGEIEVTRRRGKRRRKLLDDLKERTKL